MPPADVEWTGAGACCRPCAMALQVGRHVRNVAAGEAAAAARKLRDRSGNVGWAHAIVWTVSALVFGLGVEQGAHRAWTVPLVIVALGISIAFVLRQRWAFWATVALDVVAILAPLAAAARSGEREAWVIAGIAAAVPALLLIVVLSLRRRRRQTHQA